MEVLIAEGYCSWAAHLYRECPFLNRSGEKCPPKVRVVNASRTVRRLHDPVLKNAVVSEEVFFRFPVDASRRFRGLCAWCGRQEKLRKRREKARRQSAFPLEIR